MDYLYRDKNKEDFDLVKEVCQFILNQKVDENKEISNDWCGIYVEGRNREINDFESFCAIKSFKLNSRYNYPVYLFINNDTNLVFGEYGLLDRWNIKIIKIRELNSLEEYSKFCINELFLLLPYQIQHCITLQPDGMLLKNGFEDWILENEFDLIGSHWKHITSLYIKDGISKISIPFPSVYGCNLGFSYRNIEKMKILSKKFSNLNLKQGKDENCPEDVFYSFLGFGSGTCKLPSLKECDKWAKDPLTLDIWSNKEKWPFGFHYIRKESEFSECCHK